MKDAFKKRLASYRPLRILRQEEAPMFENLTRYLGELMSCSSFGKCCGLGAHGTDKDQAPFISYSKLSLDVLREIYAIVNAHPELRLTKYQSVLEEKGIEISAKSFEETDVSVLDGQAVMAMLVCIVRMDRFVEGLLLTFLENGKITEWIGRLKELDWEEGGAA
ncbi:MAG: hypothetical protein J5846_09250 [Desulfovibrio sp.]|nr:hypothetical protein [Desulfovibrio sp.]